MGIKLLNIGFGNIVAANRIISIISPESAPIKRIIQEAREKGMLIDATYGRRTRAVVVTDSGHVVLSSIQPETVANRLYDDEDEQEIHHVLFHLQGGEQLAVLVHPRLRLHGRPQSIVQPPGERLPMDQAVTACVARVMAEHNAASLRGETTGVGAAAGNSYADTPGGCC